MSRLLAAAAALPFLSLLVGCPHTCRYACEKMVEECDLTWEQDYAIEDCRLQCEQQENHYEDDPDAAEAFSDHLGCLLETDCETLTAEPTACCDEELYVSDFCP